MLNTKYIGTKYSWNFGEYEKTERIIMVREGKEKQVKCTENVFKKL